jgi:hypothetical protein
MALSEATDCGVAKMNFNNVACGGTTAALGLR